MLIKNASLFDDYHRIEQSIIKQLEYDFFDPRMEMLSYEEKNVLFAMSKIKNTDIVFDDVQKISKVPRNALAMYLGRLEQKGLIYNYKRGVYRFSLPMLKEYLTRKSE